MSRILVIGATGRQGGGVVDAALKNGHEVSAFVRSADQNTASLAGRGVDIVEGDLDDPESIVVAAQSVDSMFAVTTPFAGLEKEIEHGKNLVAAAQEADVKHLVFSSVAAAGEATRIGHFDTKWVTEELIRSTGIPATVIAPVFFMDNYVFPWNLADMSKGVIRQAVDPDVPLQMVDSTDIGRAVVSSIENGLIRKRIEIVGDRLTGPELADVLSRAAGREISFQRQPGSELDAMGGDWRRMYEWFNEGGFSVDSSELHSQLPDVAFRTADQWAADQDWDQLLS